MTQAVEVIAKVPVVLSSTREVQSEVGWTMVWVLVSTIGLGVPFPCN